MTGQHDIDPARAAQITERIDRGFDFVRDVIDDPRILETIPHESMLMFRTVLRRGETMRLTAYLPKHPGARWGARVTGKTPAAVAAAPPPSETQTTRDAVDQSPSVAGFETSEAALDALEAEITSIEWSVPENRRAVDA